MKRKAESAPKTGPAYFIMPMVFAVWVATALLTGYRYHIYYQEQLQLFEFTWEYFLDTIAIPGGFADWAGRFLTQFFYFAWSGAAIIILLFLAIQNEVYRLLGKRSPVSYALSFVPLIPLMVFLCNGEAMVSFPVALLLSLCTATAVLRIRSNGVKTAVELVCVPVLYFLLGPVSILFSAAVALRERKFWLFAVAAILWLASVSASYLWFGYPLYRLFYGIGYYRFHHTLPVWPWVTALVTVAVISFADRVKTKDSGTGALLVYAGVQAVTLLCVLLAADHGREEEMKYDFLARRNLWDQIVEEAAKKNPTQPNSVKCLNLALAMQGKLCDRAFTFFQNGTDGLIQDFRLGFTLSMPSAEVYLHLGMVNDARRLAFESQESIPDFQHSARCYKMLAETNLINGCYAAAEKYLIPLTHTVYYRKGALALLKLLGNEEAVDSHPFYGRLRRYRLKSEDFLYNANGIDTMLAYLMKENSDNLLALEYLLAWNLMSKDIDAFLNYCPFEAFKSVPRACQEAYLIWLAASGKLPSDAPSFIDRRLITRFIEFMKDSGNSPKADALKDKYGDTYWYYYTFYNPE